MKWSDYDLLNSDDIADADDLLVRDASDTTLGVTGTQKRFSWASMKAELLAGGLDLQAQIDDILSALQESDIYPGEISFETSGQTFAPVITLDGDATVLWTFFDGTTSDSVTPDKDFGTVGNRAQRLKVTPWSSVYRINVGYDAADGGAGDIELVSQQNVTAINNMYLVADTLIDFCANNNPITNVNLDNFILLDTIELYSADLATISIKNTPLLQRFQVELTDLVTLDLTESSNLGDVRASLNSYIDVNWGDEVFSNLWHICMRNVVGDYRIICPTPTNMPNIQDLFIWDTNQIGAGDYSNLSLLRNAQLQNNGFTSLDFTNSFSSSASLNASDNSLTSIVFAGCSGLNSIDLSNNAFDQTAINYIYTTIDTLGLSNGSIDTTGGTNAYPSATGVLAIANLEGKGWTCDYTSVPNSDAPILNTATISGTTGVVWTFIFDKNVQIGTGGSGGFAVTMTGAGAIILTYVSGDGTDTLVYSGGTTIDYDDTVSVGLNYTQPGDGIEETVLGNDMVTFSSHAVVNDSTQNIPPVAITYVDSGEAEFYGLPDRTTSSMNLVAGNVVVVCCQGWAQSVSGSVTDSLGNTYTLIGTEIIEGSIRTSWYQSLIVNSGAGTISVTFTGGNNSVGALQFSGIDTADIVGTSPVSDTGESVAITTSTDNEVIVFGGHNDGGPAVAYTSIPVTATVVLENLGLSISQGRTMGYWITSSAQTATQVGCTPQTGSSYCMSALSLNGN